MTSEAYWAERRCFARLRYPLSDCPRLTLGGKSYLVAETSQEGIVFYCAVPRRFALGQMVKATVRFHDGGIAAIEGKVLRMGAGGEVVLYLAKGISAERMQAEMEYVNPKART